MLERLYVNAAMIGLMMQGFGFCTENWYNAINLGQYSKSTAVCSILIPCCNGQRLTIIAMFVTLMQWMPLLKNAGQRGANS